MRTIINKKILNIPNLLTLTRLILTYFFVINVLDDDIKTAVIIFILAVLTDADGYVARLLNQKTKFGEIFDPIADSIFTLAAFFVLWYKDYMLLSWVLLLIIGSLLRGVGNVLMMKKYKCILVTSSIWSKLLGLFTLLIILLSLIKFKYYEYLIWFIIVWTFAIGIKWLYQGIQIYLKYKK